MPAILAPILSLTFRSKDDTEGKTRKLLVMNNELKGCENGSAKRRVANKTITNLQALHSQWKIAIAATHYAHNKVSYTLNDQAVATESLVKSQSPVSG